MASSAKHLCRTAQRQLRNSQCMRPSSTRSFHNSTRRLAEEPSSSGSEPYFNNRFYNTLDRADKIAYTTYTPSERKQMETVSSSLADEFSRDGRVHKELEESIRQELQDLDFTFPEGPVERTPRDQGFFNEGEKEDIGPDEDDFQGDDISSLGHGELEQTREVREYARLAGWEMPLLANLAKPFQPPTTSTPLRFRYTSYLGEQHPASRKVVCEFDPTDLGLTPTQTSNLIKLCGVRYNPVSKTVKLSSEDHETQAQNKRHLGSLISSLLAQAKSPESEFLKDVPLDFRHAKPKKRFQFPEEWLLTQDKKEALEERREARRLEQERRMELPEGIVDGIKAIEEARNVDPRSLEGPVMAEVKAAVQKGKQGKKQMGRGKA